MNNKKIVISRGQRCLWLGLPRLAWVPTLILGTLFSFGVIAQEEIKVPALHSRVTDLTSTLSASEVENLEHTLAEFEKTKGSQIAVLIIPTTGMEAIEQYSIKVVEKWQLGRKKVDDGALLLIAKNDRKMRIEVGYGLEGALNDATAKRIIAEIIRPAFKQGDFYQGISDGVNAIISVISGETLPEPDESKRTSGEIPSFMIVAFLIAYVLGWVINMMLGFLAALGITSGIIFLVSLISLGSFASAFFAVIVFIVLSFLFTIFLLFGGFSGGGGFGGRSGGGDSFGGGGGGSFGGGGSSGNW